MALTFQQQQLANGLTVIGEHNPAAQSVALGYFVNTGSRDEVAAESGVSHFLEHMMFKGTDARSAEDINREFDALGARYNAYTSHEHTVYYAAVLPEKTADALALLSDMMRPALRQHDFDLEKKVILEEIAMYQDRPPFRVYVAGNRHFFAEHPVGNSVLGSSQSIRDLSQQQMLDYFQRRYAANNLTFTIAGNYDWEKTLSHLQELSQDWQPHDYKLRSPHAFTPPQGSTINEDAKVKRVHIASFAQGYSAQDPRRYAAAILSRVIGIGDGSRLYWALLDKGLADAASFAHQASDGIGSYYGYISTARENQSEVLSILKQVLTTVQEEGISQAEWQRAQRTLATGITLSGETPMRRLMSLGSHYLHCNEYRSVAEVVNTIMTTEHAAGMALLEARPFDALYHYILQPTSEAA